MSTTTPAASALLTLWQDGDGSWRAVVVLPDGQRLEFTSPFELARWSRGAVRPVSGPPEAAPAGGLR